MMDLSIILLATGQRDKGLELQAQALARRRLYRSHALQGGALKVLALMAPGDFMASTPIEFLVEGCDVDLNLLYVGPGPGAPEPVSEHDVTFLAVGESAANLPLLRALEPIAAAWPHPMANAMPRRIAELTRDGVCALLEGAPGLLAPRAARLDRTGLSRLIDGALPLDAVLLGDRGYDIRLIVHDQRDAVVATAQYFGAIPVLTEPAKSKPDSTWRFTVPVIAQEPA